MAEKDSVFLHKIEAVCTKKAALLEESFWKYAARSIYAGAFLTMSTAVGAIAADKINHIDPHLGKFVFAFLFSFGLVYILFLNSELATSNMMYLSAGVFKKYITLTTAAKVLLICTLFNLLGAIMTGWLFNLSGTFQGFDDSSMLVQIVAGKLAKSNMAILVEGTLANVFVNVAILGFVLIKDEATKLTVTVSAIFMFVFFGLDHVVANFASFGLAMFNQYHIDTLTVLNTLRQWLFAFIGNEIGGGILIGVVYAWLNTTKTPYVD